MIITKLTGGLGNQMFQYAAGRALASRNNTELKLDLSWFESIIPEKKRDYELETFNVRAKIAKRGETFRLKGLRGTFPELVLANRIPKIHSILFPNNQTYFLENLNFRFEPRVPEIRGNAYLDGSWQSEKYFSDQSNQIRKDFTFKNDISPELKKLVTLAKNTNSVFIHVRRDDYLSKTNVKLFAQQNGQYYKNAIEMISNKVKNPIFFIIAGNYDWVKKKIRTKFPIVQVVTKHTSKDWQEYLKLITLCKHGITANSTWSWWGAWLNPNPNKIVIAPQKWFQNKLMDSSNIIPDSWMKI